MIQILRAKLHCIHVTASDLNYHGSITLDPVFCAKVQIYPLEFVYIWNKNNGERISTYVLPGVPGSRCCILNGAAARSCQVGDPLIISAYEYVANPKEICTRSPRIIVFDAENNPTETLTYHVEESFDWYTLTTESV